MTAQELKEKLKEEDIRKLLIEMGATFYYEDDDMWITDTICHHGTKPKLYYYKDSMSFHCYTECGQLDIIGVVMGYKDYEQEEFQKAIQNKCIVVFSTNWCPDCIFMKTYLEHLVESNKEYQFYYVDRDDMLDLCIDLEILGIPSFIAYDNGKELGRLVSKLRKTEEEVQSFIDSI